MNKHIELVKKWLDDPDSVTKEELKANRDSADDAAHSAAAADVYYVADAACGAAYYAATYAEYAAGYVKKYEELTGE